jgi:Holliday junction resolvase RusA-like endonuclease
MSYSAFTLPAPISTNSLWRPTLRKRKDGTTFPSKADTGAYKAWIIEAGYQINLQKPTKITGPYALTIQVSRACRCDLDNVVKACGDILQRHQIVENDRLAQKITLSWIAPDKLPDGSGMSVMVVSCKES